MSGRIAYYGNIVKDGLILDLDAAKRDSYPGTGTTWSDISGNARTGILTNGPTYSSANAGSIVFDGINDYVFTGSIGTLSSATLISFIKRNGSQNNYTGIICNRNQSNPNTYFGTLLLLSNQLISYWGNVQRSTVATVPDSVWCMTAFSVTPTSSTLYLYSPDGISSATSVSSHESTLTTNIWIGYDGSALARYFKGNIATSMIYNRALPQSEITQNYNALKSRFGLT